jgi:hypothetical protein
VTLPLVPPESETAVDATTVPMQRVSG